MTDKYNLSDKVAVVTGATAHIGKAVAHKLASQGATVIVSGRNEEAGLETVKEIKSEGGAAHFEHADLTHADQLEAMMSRVYEQFGQLNNLVVSGAGASSDSIAFKFFSDMSNDDINTYIKAHWLSRAFSVKAAYPYMVKSGGGKIVMIGSDAGRIATVGESMIGGSIAGMMQMTRALAREFGRENIRINTVSMSFISDSIPRWGQGSKKLESDGEKGGVLENLKKRMLFDVKTTDIAEAVSFFSSAASDAITGQTLSVNGGLSTPG
ncbi:MAG: SDR family oxidoreductase [Pseudomonadales bacterium]|nr:SDR family oxidoreductase [Pseudomonadales bacterium]